MNAPSTFFHQWQDSNQTVDLLSGIMAAVVNHNIELEEFVRQRSKSIRKSTIFDPRTACKVSDFIEGDIIKNPTLLSSGTFLQSC